MTMYQTEMNDDACDLWFPPLSSPVAGTLPSGDPVLYLRSPIAENDPLHTSTRLIAEGMGWWVYVTATSS